MITENCLETTLQFLQQEMERCEEQDFQTVIKRCNWQDLACCTQPNLR